MSTSTSIKIKIISTENVVFEGEIDRISSFNELGPFDIYYMHANFISILKGGITLYNKKQKIKELKFDQAIMKVKKDIVQVYLGMENLIVEEETAEEKNIKKISTS
jgi:F0F1-type ATP synthase epsilon subunit